jgi:hypothetical protein
MQMLNSGENNTHKDQTVVLHVRYAPAKAPYVNPKASAAMTLAEVKATALENFHLTEGTVDGGTKTYQLSFDDIVQSNLNITLGSLETHGKQLELLLIEQFVQG